MKKQILFLLLACFAVNSFAQKTDEPSGKLSGVIFGDYYYNAARDTGLSNYKNTAVTGLKDVHGLRSAELTLLTIISFHPNFLPGLGSNLMKPTLPQITKMKLPNSECM